VRYRFQWLLLYDRCEALRFLLLCYHIPRILSAGSTDARPDTHKSAARDENAVGKAERMTNAIQIMLLVINVGIIWLLAGISRELEEIRFRLDSHQYLHENDNG